MIGDIIFVQGRGWISKQIMAVTKCEYSHVAMAISDEMLIEANPRKGVCIRPISKYDKCKKKIMRLKDQTKVPKMIQFCESKLDGGYDFINALRLVLKFIFRSKRTLSDLDIKEAFICSELLASAAEFSGFCFSENIHDLNITTADILKSEKLECIS